MVDQLQILKYYLYYKYFLRFSNRKKMLLWQQKKLRRHLAFVGGHAKIYQGKKNLRDYPIADKEFMMKHFDQINTAGIRRADAEAFAIKAERERNFVPKLHGVTVGLSSGTSGKRGIFLVSDKERLRWAGYILARFLPGSILNTYSIAFFMRADSNLYESLKSRRIQFHFFDIYQDMETHLERLKQIQPDILVGQPSVLLMLARSMDNGSRPVNPKMIISIAEVLEKKDEERLKKIFKVNIIHQIYQCTEGCLATTCRLGTLHLNEDIVHIDREYLDRRRFVPVVTDFERKAQPVIRYRLNDILIEKKSPCGCKSPCLALEKIEGREDDVFVFSGKDGKKHTVFPDFIRRCLLLSNSLETGFKSDYRVVQETSGTISIYGDFSEEEREQIRQEFAGLANDRGLVLPGLAFLPYTYDPGRKMKRIEHRTATPEGKRKGR